MVTYGKHKLSLIDKSKNELNLTLPLQFSFTVAERDHCWQGELSETHFADALVVDDFSIDDSGNRTAIKDIATTRDSMLKLTYAAGGCQ